MMVHHISRLNGAKSRTSCSFRLANCFCLLIQAHKTLERVSCSWWFTASLCHPFFLLDRFRWNIFIFITSSITKRQKFFCAEKRYFPMTFSIIKCNPGAGERRKTFSFPGFALRSGRKCCKTSSSRSTIMLFWFAKQLKILHKCSVLKCA